MSPVRFLDTLKNCRAAQTALDNVLDNAGKTAFGNEISRNVVELYRLAEYHFTFAQTLPAAHWRQIVSRAYYAAYNASRSIRLHFDGVYATDVSDHEKLLKLPDLMPNKAKYETELKSFRSDRNLADYDHLAQPGDLVRTPQDWVQLADQFLQDARTFLVARGEPL